MNHYRDGKQSVSTNATPSTYDMPQRLSNFVPDLVQQRYPIMLQFNPALAWTMSRPVSKTYGNQEPMSNGPERWRTKVKTFFTSATKRKERYEKSKKSLGYEDKPLPKIPSGSSSSSTSLIIIGIEDATERDGPSFTPAHASFSSLEVHVGEECLDNDSTEAYMQTVLRKDTRNGDVLNTWKAGIEVRAEFNLERELERMLSEGLSRIPPE